jgi:hypothetical protein
MYFLQDTQNAFVTIHIIQCELETIYESLPSRFIQTGALSHQIILVSPNLLLDRLLAHPGWGRGISLLGFNHPPHIKQYARFTLQPKPATGIGCQLVHQNFEK